ncbi:MAG: hypothetical protein HQL66_06610 [Magnetococcales bacterium]|nr:hypothetical protein [Magnetococcales bacterium]
MAITDLNATLLPNEKLTLVGPGRVEFIATQPEPTAGAAKGAATAAPTAAAKGGTAAMTTTALTSKATAATTQGVIWKGTGWSLGLGLGLGPLPLGTALLGTAILGGGYYLYKRRRAAQSLWPF